MGGPAERPLLRAEGTVPRALGLDGCGPALLPDGPVRATVITFVNPAVAVLLGLVVLSEPLTWGMVVGFPLVLLGSYWATRATRTEAESDTGISPA